MREPPADRSEQELRTFGVINLDKPPGPSAHEVAAWVRDLVGVDRAAHGGTLDPKVTGSLPILLGDATRIAQVFLEGPKEYVAVLELHDSPPHDLTSVIDEFVGPIYQKPPKKSAVNRELRVREIYDCDVLETDERQVLLRIRCESGTYIRKLCHDIGLALGTGGHMGDLRRTGTGPFDDRSLVTLHELADAIAYHEEGEPDPPISIEEVILPAERALETLPVVTVAPSVATSVENGAPVYAPGVIEGPAEAAADPADPPLVVCQTPAGTAICLGRLVGDPNNDTGLVVKLERVLI